MGPQGPISDRVILRQHGSVMIRVYLLEEESSHNLSTVGGTAFQMVGRLIPDLKNRWLIGMARWFDKLTTGGWAVRKNTNSSTWAEQSPTTCDLS